MHLAETTDLIRAILAGAPAANQVMITAAYDDIDQNGDISPGISRAVTASAVAVNAVAAPAEVTTRVIKHLAFHNADTAAVTLTVSYYDGTNEPTLWKGILQTLETLVYTAEGNWRVFTAAGSIKSSSSFGGEMVFGSDAQGDIPVRGASAYDRLAIGNPGTKLMVNPAGTGLRYDSGQHVSMVATGMAATDDPLFSEFDYTVAPGTTGALNILDAPGCRMGYWVLGAGQTILGPVAGADGMDVACDQADNEGLEMFTNWGPADGRPFTVGLTPAFFMRAKFSIAVINGCDDLFVGFRLMDPANPNRANMTDYDTYFGLGIVTAATPGVIEVIEELNGAAGASTDTTDTIASATVIEMKVMVSAAGVATCQHDALVPGTLAAPTVTSAFTFDDGDVVIPIFRFLHANAAQAGAILLKEFEAGLQ
jgi:hypothetical protein